MLKFLLSFFFVFFSLLPMVRSQISIRTCQDLQNINPTAKLRYALMNDIDCSNVTFKPIGDSFQNPFMGIFNGGFFTIANLSFTIGATGGTSTIGLFGGLSLATVANVSIVFKANITDFGFDLGGLCGHARFTDISNVYTWGDIVLPYVSFAGSSVGGLCGSISRTQVTNCSSSVSITSQSSAVGGLVGYVEDSNITKSSAGGLIQADSSAGGLIGLSSGQTTDCIISESYATTNVFAAASFGTSASSYAGGLIGTISYTNINRCYARGQVGGKGFLGGLIGYFSNSVVTDSYALGAVNGTQVVGGAIGYFTSNSVTNIYASGSVIGTDPATIGGLIGQNTKEVRPVSSYWDIQSTGQAKSQGGEARSTSDMYQQSNYVNWNFDNVWAINDGHSYPWLRGLATSEK